MNDQALTPAQVADRLQVSLFTVQRWLRQGKLKGFKVGSLWRIKEVDFDEFIRKGEKPREK